jgi:proteasome lid subunit RPN8/RPN11
VLCEIGDLAREAGESEMGGLLVGHVRRDVRDDDLFIEVTAQLPARCTGASATRLTFTSDTWAALGDALTQRHFGEIALGWFHSHPVHAWCAKCKPERREVCSLRAGFLSAEDRLLHRAMFPRAYSLALLVNQLTPDASSFVLFGWRRGLLAARGYHRVNAPSLVLSPSGITTGEPHALRY